MFMKVVKLYKRKHKDIYNDIFTRVCVYVVSSKKQSLSKMK